MKSDNATAMGNRKSRRRTIYELRSIQPILSKDTHHIKNSDHAIPPVMAYKRTRAVRIMRTTAWMRNPINDLSHIFVVFKTRGEKKRNGVCECYCAREKRNQLAK